MVIYSSNFYEFNYMPHQIINHNWRAASSLQLTNAITSIRPSGEFKFHNAEKDNGIIVVRHRLDLLRKIGISRTRMLPDK